MNKTAIERLQPFFDEQELDDMTSSGNALLHYAYENMEIGSFSDAARLFHVYLSDNSHIPEALNGLAVCMYELEEYDKALKIIDYTLAQYPEDPISLSNKASICWQYSNYEQAVYYYNRSLELDPDLIESKLNLVNLYRENGDLILAYISCLKLHEERPQNIEVKELLDSLMIDIAIMFY